MSSVSRTLLSVFSHPRGAAIRGAFWPYGGVSALAYSSTSIILANDIFRREGECGRVSVGCRPMARGVTSEPASFFSGVMVRARAY